MLELNLTEQRLLQTPSMTYNYIHPPPACLCSLLGMGLPEGPCL